MWEVGRALIDLTEQLVTRAHGNGSLRSDATTTDIMWLVEHFSRAPRDHTDSAPEVAARARLLALAIDGLHTRPHDQLPGSPTPRAQYEHRWTAAP